MTNNVVKAYKVKKIYGLLSNNKSKMCIFWERGKLKTQFCHKNCDQEVDTFYCKHCNKIRDKYKLNDKDLTKEL